ncbi:MAG: CvpA family protein [Pseudomonadota bacterium]
MNLLDIIICVFMALLIIQALYRGFFREVGSLGGVILGISFANFFQPQVAGLLRPFLPPGIFLTVIGFVLVFLVVLVLCNLIGRGLDRLFGKALTGWANKIPAAGLAALKGFILIYFGIVLLIFFVPSKAPMITKSRLAPLIISSYQSVVGAIFSESHHRERKTLEK